MHSHDRTMIASFAFGDPDKREPRHDLAIQYLAQESVRDGLIEMLMRGRGQSSYFLDWADSSAESERPISKGEGKYKTTVGFVDLVISFNSDWNPEKVRKEKQYRVEEVLVEVKVKPVPLGDVKRQILFYREYPWYDEETDHTYYVLATAYDLSVEDVEDLAKAGISHVRLGAKFEDYCAERQASPAKANSPEI